MSYNPTDGAGFTSHNQGLTQPPPYGLIANPSTADNIGASNQPTGMPYSNNPNTFVQYPTCPTIPTGTTPFLINEAATSPKNNEKVEQPDVTLGSYMISDPAMNQQGKYRDGIPTGADQLSHMIRTQPGIIHENDERNDTSGTHLVTMEGDDEMKGFNFSTQSIRKQFIRKVYGILVTQLLATMVFMAWFMFHEPTKQFVLRNLVIFWVDIALVFAVLLVLMCHDGLRRTAPHNLVLLGIFTVGMSYMVGLTVALTEVEVVLVAVGITAAIVIALTIFAFQTKWDFTTMGGILLSASVAILLFGIVTIFWRGEYLRLFYSFLVVILMSFYIVYDTQLMIGGNHKNVISPEEYVYAALTLYLDIIDLFLHILRLLKK